MERSFIAKADGIVDQLKVEATLLHKGKEKVVTMLWDTGANASNISSNIVHFFDLPVMGFGSIGGSHGFRKANYYEIDILLPGDIKFCGHRVYETNIGDYGIDLLVGMDIIQFGDFVINNYQGRTSFSFRVPSKEIIDYTQQ